MKVDELVKLLSGPYRHFKIIVPALEVTGQQQTEFRAEKIIPYVAHSMWTGCEWDIKEHTIKRELTIVMHHVNYKPKNIILNPNGN